MLYTPRTIAFLCDLQHPGAPPDPAAVQRIHNRLFQSPEPTYRSFHVTHEGAALSNPTTRPDAISSVLFRAGRILFREQMTGVGLDEFRARVVEITSMACEQLSIGIFTAQQVTVRSLVNPRHFNDSREFLKHGLFGLGQETADFGREPQLYGMRMVFPATHEQPQNYSLRIESCQHDPRSLWIENCGTFPAIFASRGLDPVAAHIQESYDFLVQRALRFVGNFDGGVQP